MEARLFEAGRGLRLMFWGELLFLTATACILLGHLAPAFPAAAKVLTAASFLFSLFGLVTAVRAYEGYQSALIFLVVSIILRVAVNWAEERWIAAFLHVACAAVNYFMVSGVCTASAALLVQQQDADSVRRSTKARQRYLACSAVSVACFLAGALFRFGALTEIVWIMGEVVSLFACLIYLLFLHDAQELMRE